MGVGLVQGSLDGFPTNVLSLNDGGFVPLPNVGDPE